MIRGVVKSFRNCGPRCQSTENRCWLISAPCTKLSWITSRNSCNLAREERSLRSNIWAHIQRWIHKNVQVLQRHLTEQCEFVVAQRLRRAYQIWVLYSQLYSDKTMRAMVSKLSRKLATQQRPLGLLLGTALFNWDKENITDDDMSNCACEIVNVENLLGSKLPHGSPRLKTAVCQPQDSKSWELVINKENLKVWRKSVDNSYLYEYKVFGSFYDIPARAFFRVQTDIEYRKKWDNLVIKLNIIDTKSFNDKNHSQAEVVHWVMHYPYPMYGRDYVYVRRYMIDEQNKLMVFVSRATKHPDIPVDKSYVRVNNYKSQLVIRPHSTFDNKGFDYVLTYFDDPQAAFPGPAYSWMTTSGVPAFVNKLHDAALCLQQKEKGVDFMKTRKRSKNKQGGWKIF